MKEKIIILLILILELLSCSKENSNKIDNRDKYLGKYLFKIENVNWWMTSDSIGWGSTRDTFNRIGSIEKFREEQILIKYNDKNISGLWTSIDSSCNQTSIGLINDTSIIPADRDYLIFWGYYENWTSPAIVRDSLLKMPCITFDTTRGGIHETFGGYFITNDSVYFGYSSGGLGAGSYSEIIGLKLY